MSAQASQPVVGAKAAPPGEAKVSEELAKIPYEPLLPIEKKLIVWSLVLGAVLMVILVWASHTFFKI